MSLKFLLLFIVAINAICNRDPTELDNARRENIFLEGFRLTTDNYTLYTEISNAILNTSTITFYLEAVGVFPPEDAIDYTGLLVPNPPLLPIPESRQVPNKDFTQVREVAPDIYFAPGRLLALNVYDPVLDDYVFKQDGVRTQQYIYFDECSELINTVISRSDRPYIEFQDEVLSPNFPPELVCQIGFGVCAAAGLLNETGFFSISECIDQYETIPAETPCPSTLSSDTLFCRAIHAFSAIINATVHCPHLQFTSPVCFDRCLPDCADCSPNAHCVEQFNETRVLAGNAEGYLDYFCECDDGYIGNGTYCEIKTCSQVWECQTPSGLSGNPYHQCIEGICKCAPTLTWNPTTGACECRADQQLEWSQGLPVCLDAGKCLERWQCAQDFNDVKCRQYEFENRLSIGDFCLCNPGFENYGVENPDCICNGQRVWVQEINGNVCIQGSECVFHWNCPQDEFCNKTELIGNCAKI